jgi:hypothetical protein
MGAAAARHDGGKPMLYAFAIYYDGRDRIPYDGPLASYFDQALQLAPGEHHDTEFTIQDTYDLSRPGRYVVRVAYAGFDDDHPHPHGWQGLLVHPDIEFTVGAKSKQ